MVLFEQDYVAQGQMAKRKGNQLDRRAEDIAVLVASLCFDVPAIQTGIFRTVAEKAKAEIQGVVSHLDVLLAAGDYKDPGEPFTLEKNVFLAVEQLAYDKWGRR
jgi:CTP:molybdopterin cytidylyltransferase MocA